MNTEEFNPLPRTRDRPLTCLGDAREVDDGGSSEFASWMPSQDSNRQVVRKWWEWDYLAGCAETLGLLRPGARAVGMGVGHEPLIFYFAQAGCSVLATDLYAGNTAWSEARFGQTEAVHAASPKPYPRENVEIAHADMRRLPCEDASADFVWSCSSIEHVPTLIDLFDVMHEAYRVLKPGGYALLTTEYAVSGQPYLLPGVNAWDAGLLGTLESAFGGFEWVGPRDLTYAQAHPANAARPRRYPPPGHQHRYPQAIAEPFRGGHMGVLLGVSVCVPIGLVLRKQTGTNLTWAQATVDPDVRDYSEAIAAFNGGREPEAVSRLQPLYERLRNRPESLQLAMHTGRFLIDCHTRLGMQRRPEQLGALIEQYLTLCPPGKLQDADCLDLCAYLLGEIGEFDRSAEVSRKCLASPSTNLQHIFDLAGRFLKTEQRAGRLGSAINEAAVILADLAWSGVDSQTFGAGMTQGIDIHLSRRPRAKLRSEIDHELKTMAQDLRQRGRS